MSYSTSINVQKSTHKMIHWAQVKRVNGSLCFHRASLNVSMLVRWWSVMEDLCLLWRRGGTWRPDHGPLKLLFSTLMQVRTYYCTKTATLLYLKMGFPKAFMYRQRKGGTWRSDHGHPRLVSHTPKPVRQPALIHAVSPMHHPHLNSLKF